MTSLRDKQIFIVGPLKVQNRLMSSFLELETGATCMNVKDFYGVHLAIDVEAGNQSLALWDCFGNDLERLLSEFGTDMDGLLPRHYVALFNVIPGLGIEEEAIARGARGFFYLEEPLKTFKQGVHAIFDGEVWASRKIMSEYIIERKQRNPSQGRYNPFLTTREIEILQMVAEGYSNARIADGLCISPHTVKTHLYNTYKKIKASGRLQAALWAVKNLRLVSQTHSSFPTEIPSR